METITLTMKDQKRVNVIEMVFRGEVSIERAAFALDVSVRQLYRIKSRIKEKGVKGVVHGNKGKSCPWKIDEELRERILRLYREKYAGFNDHHFAEKLVENESVKSISREKVRQILRASGIAPKRKRRPPKYRSKRARKEMEGMMLQVDGSPHDWLEGRGERLCLIGAIDDATNKVPAAFFTEEETTDGYFKVFLKAFRKKGLPLSIYSDRATIFFARREPTLQEQLQGKRPLTQVGRALDELGIKLKLAYSPQAKGRIERLWGTLQDRLVSELRLAGASTKEEANRVLKEFLPKHNMRFAKPPKSVLKAWQTAPDALTLKRILCKKYTRKVKNDNTISFDGMTLQIPKMARYRTFAGRTVDVLVLSDGTVELRYQDKYLTQFKDLKIQFKEVI